MREKQYFLPAGQVAAAHVNAARIRFLTRDKSGLICGWPDTGDRYQDRPVYNINIGAWTHPDAVKLVFGYLRIKEFYDRQYHMCIVDVKESKAAYLQDSRPRKQQKNNYEWSENK